MASDALRDVLIAHEKRDRIIAAAQILHARGIGCYPETIEALVRPLRTDGDAIRREIAERFACTEEELLAIPGKRWGRAGRSKLALAVDDLIATKVEWGEWTAALVARIFDPDGLHSNWVENRRPGARDDRHKRIVGNAVTICL